MSKCYRCNGWSDGGLCSACRRNEEIARNNLEIARNNLEEQREIAENQIAEQERIAYEANLNSFKIKILNVILLSVTKPIEAKASASIILNNSTFKNNIEWFWSDVWDSHFLRDVYFEKTLQPLFENVDHHDFFEDLRLYNRVVYNHIQAWINQFDESTKWHKLILPKYLDYHHEFQANEAIAQTERANSHAKYVQRENIKRRCINLVAILYSFLSGIVWVYVGWFAFKNIQNTEYALPSTTGTVSAIIIYFIACIFHIKKPFGNNYLQSYSIITVAIIIYMSWGTVNDSRIHVGIVIAGVISIYIPVINNIFGIVARSFIYSAIAAGCSWVGGYLVDAIFLWFSHSHIS
jgi:hypothetical protein